MALAVLMVGMWLTEVVPIYLTALVPIIIGPSLGIIDSSQLAAAYGDKNVFLFLGGFALALALEKWRVHEQVARRILQALGKDKTRLILGFMISTALLSMWISNTATTLMMLPMALAVVKVDDDASDSRFPLLLLLSIAYSASIGGMATLVGSPPNIQMAGILKAQFDVNVDFMAWMQIGFPLTIAMLGIAYFFFWFLLRKESADIETHLDFEPAPWTSPQLRVIGVFLFVVVLWIARSSIVKHTGFAFNDTAVALLGTFLLFVVSAQENQALLDWNDTKDLPWGILLLFGGGLALAGCLETNGVIASLSDLFAQLSSLHYFILILMLVAISIFGTELMSNLALVTVFVPVVASFAMASSYSILQLCLPITLAASCAFMLPVGTPPNAIVFSSGKITIPQMAKVGFALNIFALLLISSVAYFFLNA